MDFEGTNSINIPLIDLRCFCQDELLLAADLSGHFPEARFPNLIIPTLDKNFFNTSLASRKQTYRRRPRGPREKLSSPAAWAQAAAPRQSRPLPRAHLLVENKKTKLTLSSNLKKIRKKLQSTGLKQRSEKLVDETQSLILKTEVNSRVISSRSGRPDADANPLLEPSRQMESRAIRSEPAGLFHGQALQPTAKRMRLKDGARNRLMFQKQVLDLPPHSNGREEAGRAQQLSSTEYLDHDRSSHFQDLQIPGGVSETAMEGEGFKKEETRLDAVAEVDGKASTPKVEDPWISRHMENKILMAREFETGWQVPDCFGSSSGLDELEFSNRKRYEG